MGTRPTCARYRALRRAGLPEGAFSSWLVICGITFAGSALLFPLILAVMRQRRDIKASG